jgi:hypothetical protein
MANDIDTAAPRAIAAYLNSGRYDPTITFKQGRYNTGRAEVPLGSSFLALPLQHKIGWQHWANNLPDKSVMGVLHENFEPPPREHLGDTNPNLWERDDAGRPRDPWQKSEQLPMLTDEEKTYVFVTSSMGGHAALVTLQQKFFDAGRRCNPVIELQTEMFSNSYGSRNHKPVFKIVGWDEADAKPAPIATRPTAPKRPAADIIDDEIGDFAIKR